VAPKDVGRRKGTTMAPPIEGDAALMTAFLQKEPDATRRLYDRFASRIFGLGLVLFRNRTDAEDLVQDTFLKIWRTGSAFDPVRGPLEAWILLSARSLAIDLLRHRSVAARKLSAQAKVSEASDETGPEWHAEVGDLFRRATEAMASLPQRQRSVLELTYLGQRSTKEVAELMGIPRGTVKSRAHAGIAVLQKAFQGDDDAA
jgi:RNA polymerase sigma-70 factor (ECF subfamily)